MKYNTYVYLPRVGSLFVMALTCIALWSNTFIFNIIYLFFVVFFSQLCFIYEKRLLKNHEPQYQKISFRDSLLMYPILLKMEWFLFIFVSTLSVLILLCINKKIMAMLALLVVAIILFLYLQLKRH